MAAALFENLADGVKQAVQNSMEILKEQNTPTWSSIKKTTAKKSLSEKGWRIPYTDRMPGGHTAFTGASTAFNVAVAPQSVSMWVYPVRYALPMQFDGGFLRAFKANSPDAVIKYQEILDLYVKAAAKRINQMCYGDGSGALAFVTNAESAGAGVTCEMDTTAAAGYGHTKGAKWLLKGHTYDSVTAAGVVDCTFVVTTEGSTSCVATVGTGDTDAGDLIVDTGAWNKYFRGFAHLISNTSRTMQGLATSSFADLNAYGVDLAGSLVTVSTLEQAKTGLEVRSNTDGARTGLLCYAPPGQLSLLRIQGYNLSQYIRNTDDGDVVKGVAEKFVSGDTIFVKDADCCEDRFYFVNSSEMSRFEEMPFGEYDLDGQDLRMVLGSNSTGSDTYQRAIGWVGNLGISGAPKASAFIKRAQISTSVTQVNAS